MRNFLMALPIALMAGGALAQESATVTDNCANHLNTSPDPTVGALLNCLAEMQRTIDRLEASVSAQAALSQSDIAAVAQELKDNHLEAIKGEPGEGAQIPSGMVFASTLACTSFGDGWETFREATGRLLIGAGNETLRAYRQWRHERPTGGFESINLTEYEVLATGGEEHHTLSESEMPSHAHKIDDRGHSHPITPHNTQNSGSGTVGWLGGRGTVSSQSAGPSRTGIGIEAEGGGTSHNNMPPYIALYFCKKA